MRRTTGCALLLLASLTARTVAAQSDTASLSDCIARLPASVFTRVTVVLQVDAIESSAPSRQVLPSLALVTQSVAARLRELLGAGTKQLPAGDPVLSWRQLSAPLVVAVYPDGRFSWRRDDEWQPETDAHRAGSDLLERALAAVRDSGERVYFPEGAVQDSLLFRLAYLWPGVTRFGQIEPLPLRVAFPVFTLPTPWLKPVAPIRPPRPRYPEGSILGGAEGTLILQFVVDTSGRADMRTVRDLWPRDRPRLTGELGAHYEAFLAAVTSALRGARYEPAQIGGWLVRHLVRVPCAVKLRR